HSPATGSPQGPAQGEPHCSPRPGTGTFLRGAAEQSPGRLQEVSGEQAASHLSAGPGPSARRAPRPGTLSLHLGPSFSS
ncbi:unnamed protein product, partial [Rangifer tarandus platyrhynchus]